MVVVFLVPEYMNSEDQIQQDLLLPDIVSEYPEGRDELNLAEFPLTLMGSRAGRDAKSITFQDTTYDRASGQLITRRLTITGAETLGLPTALDDEVLLGMLQLSRIQGFQDQRVVFRPLDLLRIMGWPPCGANYTRLKKALERWLGVSVFYENAWREKSTGEWIDAAFHFIDNLELPHRDGRGTAAAGRSAYFRWNDTVFRNLCAGSLKVLDFRLYRQLSSGIARRMFRFLDKRFYHRDRLTFDLETFAFEKIGLARGGKLNIAHVKRQLGNAIGELEKTGFIKREKERFSKTAKRWEIHFERGMPDSSPPEIREEEQAGPLEQKLTGLGMTPMQARRLTQRHASDRIEAQLDHLAFLCERKSAPANPAGWLVGAMRDGYAAPVGFQSKEEREQEAQKKAAKAAQTLRKRKEAQDAAEVVQTRAEAVSERVEAFLQRLSPAAREAIEAEALGNSPLGSGAGEHRPHMREAIIRNHVEGLLGGR